MSPGAKTFEDLWIWQQSRQLVKNVYRDFGDATAAGKDFGFRGQIQRAAVSLMNNIAEGFERGTSVDFARFLDMAKGSCGEVRGMYYIAEDLEYVSPAIASDRRDLCRKIAAGIAALATHLRSS
jgi:four helix bundle protein